MLATFTVTNNSDGPVNATGDLPGSLRQAIFDSNALSGPDTITFAASVSGSTIALTEGELVIADDLRVIGPGVAENLVIDAQQQSRVFRVTSSAREVALNALTVTNGRTTGDSERGGGILFQRSDGRLTLTGSTVSHNSTTGRNASGGGISATGFHLELTDSRVHENSVPRTRCRGGWHLLKLVPNGSPRHDLDQQH